jgi:hypothetical protein
MNTWRIPLTLVLAALSASTAQAQIGQLVRPQVNPRPTISPYLSIFRGQNNAAINYFNFVRPQLEMGRQMQMLQSEVQSLQAAPPIAPVAGAVPVDQPFANMPTTGHPVTFMNLSHFYPGRPGSPGGGGPAGFAGGVGNPLGFANPSAPLRMAVLAGAF